MEPEFLRTSDVARLLDVSMTTVRRYITPLGVLKATRMGRLWVITPEDLRRFTHEYKGERRRSDRKEE